MAVKTPSKPPAKPTSGSEEKPKNDAKGGAKSGMGNLTTPEGVLMISLAVIFDGVGLFPGVGWISDAIGVIFFGMWAFVFKKKNKLAFKFIIALVLEAIPIVSDITPFISAIGMLFSIKIPASWIGFVYLVLSSD